MRHRNAFADGSDRAVSLVLYLNERGTAADGGHLRIHGGGSHVDVDPVGGTMMCFTPQLMAGAALIARGVRRFPGELPPCECGSRRRE